MRHRAFGYLSRGRLFQKPSAIFEDNLRVSKHRYYGLITFRTQYLIVRNKP
jgi:hypothetical protein